MDALIALLLGNLGTWRYYLKLYIKNIHIQVLVYGLKLVTSNGQKMSARIIKGVQIEDNVRMGLGEYFWQTADKFGDRTCQVIDAIINVFYI